MTAERFLRYNHSMADPASDPLVWRRIKAPSLVELEILAAEVFRHLPRRFRDLCADVVIQLDSDGVRASGRGLSTDVVEAAARAYVAATNRVVRAKARTAGGPDAVRLGEVMP